VSRRNIYDDGEFCGTVRTFVGATAQSMGQSDRAYVAYPLGFDDHATVHARFGVARDHLITLHRRDHR
jgi:hypothetical protein